MNPQARLGAFVLIAIVAFGLISSKVGGFVLFKEKANVVEAEFDDLMGLELQAAVRMAGVRVGTVQEIKLRDNKGVVSIALEPWVKLPVSTRAMIMGRGMVGEKYISLRAKQGDHKLLAHGAMIPADSSGDMNVFIAQVAGIAGEIHSLIKEVSLALGSKDGGLEIGKLVSDLDAATVEFSGLLKDNRENIKATMASLHASSESIEQNLPHILTDIHHITSNISILLNKNRENLNLAAKALPETLNEGKKFFHEGGAVMGNLDKVLLDNRENAYRMIFELRKMAENLDEFSDDLRRNPWKLMIKRPEVPPSPRAKQKKMEEMLLSTGQMGIEPAHQ